MRRDSDAPLLLAVAAVLALLPAPAESQIVEGRLLEGATGRPIPFGIVTLADTTGEVRRSVLTDTTGYFLLEAAGPGSYLVVGGGMGYASHAEGVDLGDGGYMKVDFYLRPRPVELPGLLATVERVRTERYLDGQGFYDRRKMGFGSFIGPEEVEVRQPADARDLLRRVAQVRVADGGFAGEAIYCRGVRGWESPRLFVDGVQIGFPQSGAPVDLEQVVEVTDIAAVEVFTRASQLPARFSGTGTPCVILVWTKGHR